MPCRLIPQRCACWRAISVADPLVHRLGDLADGLRRIDWCGHDLVIDFDPSAEPALAAVVAAEQLCCSDLGWQLEQPTRLRVVGSQLQLELVARVLQRAEWRLV